VRTKDSDNWNTRATPYLLLIIVWPAATVYPESAKPWNQTNIVRRPLGAEKLRPESTLRFGLLLSAAGGEFSWPWPSTRWLAFWRPTLTYL
jgi:hypothetical protein